MGSGCGIVPRGRLTPGRYLANERCVPPVPSVDRLLDFLASLTPSQVVMGLAIVSALMMIIEERRLSLVPLLIQYILLGLLVGPRFYRPIMFVRAGLGMAICLILYVTAQHVQEELGKLTGPNGPRSLAAGNLGQSQEEGWDSPLAPAWRAINLAGMGSVFRLIVIALGGIMAYGIWRTFPLSFVPAEINLTSYWLICIGLLLILTSADPLRMGFGLLTCINGFESLYLFLEQSLIVIGLLGVADIIIALSVVICAEAWLDSLKEGVG